jgi:hypothetical protein
MIHLTELCLCTMFCFEVYILLVKLAYGKLKMSRTQAFDWCSKFRSGLTSLHHAKCSVYPSAHKVGDCDVYQGPCLQKNACLSGGGSLIWIMLKCSKTRYEHAANFAVLVKSHFLTAEQNCVAAH